MTGTGLKKCIPTNRAAPRLADGRGQRVDRDRARVRGEDRAVRRPPVELRPEAALDLEVLEDRLDDEPGGGGVGRVGRRADPGRASSSRAAGSSRPFCDRPLEVPGDPVPAGLGTCQLRLVQDDAPASGGEDLGDAVAHEPCAADEDLVDRHRTESLPARDRDRTLEAAASSHEETGRDGRERGRDEERRAVAARVGDEAEGDRGEAEHEVQEHRRRTDD